MQKTHNNIFVYGTLRKDSNHLMQQWLATKATFVARATLTAKLYAVSYYPAAVLCNNLNQVVYGDVYQISENNTKTVLQKLDQFEGCDESFIKPHEYSRVICEVKLQTGQILPVWVYLYNWDVSQLPAIVSGDFLLWQSMQT